MKGQLDVLQAALPTDGASAKSFQATWKLAQDFWKLDDLLFDAAEGFIKGELQDPSKVRLDDAFKKIIDDAASIDGSANGLLLPAVQKVREAASVYLTDLNGLSGLNIKKASVATWKIAEDFMDVDRLIYKVGVDAVMKGELAGIKGESPGVFLGQLDEAVIKIGREITAGGDSSLIGLLPAVQDVESTILPYIRGLVGDGKFPGGVTLPDGGGDVITPA